MRYIHNGELTNRTIDPPRKLVFDEPVSSGTGKATAGLGTVLRNLRKTDSRPIVIGHEPSDWRGTDR